MTDTWRSGVVARRIDHVGVVVTDIDTAAARFAADFGLIDEHRWQDPDGRFELCYLMCGDTTLQLVQPLMPGPLQTWLDERGEGLHHVCFAVDDLDAALAAIPGGPAGPAYVGGRDARVCFLAEQPHGLTIELTESAGRQTHVAHTPADRAWSA